MGTSICELPLTPLRVALMVSASVARVLSMISRLCSVSLNLAWVPSFRLQIDQVSHAFRKNTSSSRSRQDFWSANRRSNSATR
jgi:hypothetical protein